MVPFMSGSQCFIFDVGWLEIVHQDITDDKELLERYLWHPVIVSWEAVKVRACD